MTSGTPALNTSRTVARSKVYGFSKFAVSCAPNSVGQREVSEGGRPRHGAQAVQSRSHSLDLVPA